MHNKTLRLLKRIRCRWYRLDETNGKCKDKHNEHINILLTNKFINAKGEYNVTNGCQDIFGYEITIDGETYLQERRKRTWGFVLPWLITTLIAAGALAMMIKDFAFGRC